MSPKRSPRKIAQIGLVSALTGLAGTVAPHNAALASTLRLPDTEGSHTVSMDTSFSDTAPSSGAAAPQLEARFGTTLQFSSAITLAEATTFPSASPPSEADAIAQAPDPDAVSPSAEIEGDTPTVDAVGDAGPDTVENTSDRVEARFLDASQVQILSPSVGTVLDVPAATVILQYPDGGNVELRVNGERVDPASVGRTAVDPETNLVTQTWYGVSLTAGSNTITVVPVDGDDVFASVDVQVRGVPVELTVSTRGDRVAADGRSTIPVQGQLLDENNNTSNWNTVVTLTASDGTFIGADYSPDIPGFQVEAVNGRYSAELQSSLEANLVQLEAKANGLTAYNQVQFTTQQRPTLVTGILDLRFGAQGTNFYGSLRDFLELDAEGYEFDFTGAVFATGNLGEWLFTGAYNSDRPLNEDCTGETTLFRQNQTCGSEYLTYGDNSSSDILAPSIDSLYLRFERTSPVPGAGSDYFLWGDFTTEEFSSSAQLYTATSRSLHGFKTHFNWGDLGITGFFANNVEGFQRDTIAPDGTSGTYFLSKRLVLSGSEEVYLELEELDRPGTVLERQRLYRGADYEIDYDRGSLFFRDPILRTSIGDFGEILVRRIVVTYQFEGDSDGDTNIYGGRLQYTFDRTLGQESWLGASYLRENQGDRAFELYGADARIALGDSAEILAEYAYSRNRFDLTEAVSGSAYRLEFNGDITRWLQGRAYYRHTDEGFSNLATESFRPGQTRYGAQVSARLSPDTTLRVQYDHEKNRGVAPQPLLSLEDLIEPGSSPEFGSPVNNDLTTISVGLSQRLGASQLELDWIHRDRQDNAAIDRPSSSSDQIRTRLTTDWGDGLTVFAQNELNISSDSDPLYPSRTLFGLEWQLLPGISLGVGQVFVGENLNDRDGFTTIDLSGEYHMGEDTTIHGQLALIDGQQIGGRIGFDQGFTLSPGLRLELGYERLFNNRYGSTAAGEQFIQPFAVGSGASALQLTSGNSFNVGLSYTDNADFQASTRFEHRTSSHGSNTVFTASALGRLSPAISTLFDFRMSRAANQGLDLGTSSTLKLGLAYRNPQSDKFNALLRYEYRKNPYAGPEDLLFGSTIDTSEHLLSAEAIYAPNWRWELYGKYAFRTTSTTLGGIEGPETDFDEFTSNSAVHLAQLRATYRLGYSWDITGEARWIGSSIGYSEFGAAAELGYYISPDLRLYAGYSVGGAYDRDFSGASRTVGGPYIGITAKLGGLFNGFGTPAITPPQQQESVIEEGETPAAETPETRDDTDAPEDSTEASEATPASENPEPTAD